MRIPADTSALHRPGFGHRVGKSRVKAKVESAAQDVLAVLGNTKVGAGQHRIGLGGTVGGQDRRLGLADGVEHIGQEIDHPEIHLRLLFGVMIAEENAEFRDGRFDRALITAVCAIKSFPGVRIDQPQPTRRNWWAGNRVRRRRPCDVASYQGEKRAAVHSGAPLA